MMFDPCPACDGRGDDGDMLWPRRCADCEGSGMRPLDDDYPEDDEVELPATGEG